MKRNRFIPIITLLTLLPLGLRAQADSTAETIVDRYVELLGYGRLP